MNMHECEKPPFKPLERKIRTRVPPEEAGRTLLDWLASRFRYLDAEGWREQLANGRLLLDGRTAAGDVRLAGGERLEFMPRGLAEPPVCWDVRVVYEDARYLVIDKPGRLPCHPGGAFFNHTLWAWLKRRKGLEDIHFVNRLDRETSGLLLVARDAPSAAAAAKALTAPGAVREYLAMVEGADVPEHVLAEGWIGPARGGLVRKKRRFYRAGEELPEGGGCEPARTEFFRVDADRSAGLALLRARLSTGRTHQIRATLLGLGHPVAGDKLYGVDERLFLKWIGGALTGEDMRRLRFPRQALHASRLRIDLPGAAVREFASEWPADLAAREEQAAGRKCIGQGLPSPRPVSQMPFGGRSSGYGVRDSKRASCLGTAQAW